MIYNTVGIGAGPSNLSLAAQAADRNVDLLLLESKSEVRWHPGMLLPESRLDTHFTKDLVTLVNPTSRFTFLNFLKEIDRLDDFLNCGSPNPFRHEFDQYIKWVASHLGEGVRLDSKVANISFSKEKGAFKLSCENGHGEISELFANNIVIGTGGAPKHIFGSDHSDKKVIHSSEFLSRLSEIDLTSSALKILIVGAGQSAAEIGEYLLHHSVCQIDIAMGDYSFTSKEGTSFINQSYNGSFVDQYYKFDESDRKWFKEARKNMNFGVVDSDLLHTLYNGNYYSNHFLGRSLNIRSFDYVQSVEHLRNLVSVSFSNRIRKSVTKEKFDFLVVASGYQPSFDAGKIGHLLEGDEIELNRNYSIANLSEEISGSIYYNGQCSGSHGPSQEVLSVISHRSKDILESIFP